MPYDEANDAKHFFVIQGNTRLVVKGGIGNKGLMAAVDATWSLQNSTLTDGKFLRRPGESLMESHFLASELGSFLSGGLHFLAHSFCS